MTISVGGVGGMVRRWRERRRRSQLDLSRAADVSTRHLSLIEAGRAIPSRATIERLCDELDVPLRDRNALYFAAGLAAVHRERPLTELGEAQAAIEAVLAGHEPNPAAAVNAHWDVLTANQAMTGLLTDLPGEVTGPPLNLLRATLHPDGLGERLLNPAQWRTHTLRRVRRKWERTADPILAELLAELESFPEPAPAGLEPSTSHELATPLRLKTDAGELCLLYTVTVFGSPQDITLDEIAIETFFPADAATRTLLTELAEE